MKQIILMAAIAVVFSCSIKPAEKQFLMETNMGNIRVKLYNETPLYRDNFIRLVEENFYDSLLIHRVVPRFVIQGGAPDSKYAAKGDTVGSEDLDYSLPAHIIPGLYHKRGVLAAPREGDQVNYTRRAHGSQFYIVAGKTYTDEDLDQIGQKNNHVFLPEQREVYKTTGGAAHLDGAYTIFGEVTEGMDVVDRISEVPADSLDRPMEDIRILRIKAQ